MSRVKLRGTAYISVASIDCILDFSVLSPCMIHETSGRFPFLFYYRLLESPLGEYPGLPV